MRDLTITSLQNPRVKQAARLRDHRHRVRERQFLIDGARELRRAIESGIELLDVFYCEELCQGAECREAAALLPRSQAQVLRVTRPVFEKLAFGERAEGLLAVARMPERRLEDFELPRAALVAVLVGVEKPGNIGAVLRSADAAGVHALIVADPRTDLYNPNCVRASMGAIFRVPAFEASGTEGLGWLRRQALQIVATRVKAPLRYTEIDFTAPTAIVLGSEDKGLPSLWQGDDVTGVSVPMYGIADSLNVSVTAAVLFYEAIRQREMLRR